MKAAKGIRGDGPLDGRTSYALSGRWAEENPEKRRAQSAVLTAKRRGDLVAPETCPRCGKEGKIEAHHEDYSKPLEVTWLCWRCHKAEHGHTALNQHQGEQDG